MLLDVYQHIHRTRGALLPRHNGAGAPGGRGSGKHGSHLAGFGGGIFPEQYLGPLATAHARSAPVRRHALAENLEALPGECVQVVLVDLREAAVGALVAVKGAGDPALGIDPFADLAVSAYRPHRDPVRHVILDDLPANLLAGVASDEGMLLYVVDVLGRGADGAQRAESQVAAELEKCPGSHVLVSLLVVKGRLAGAGYPRLRTARPVTLKV